MSMIPYLCGLLEEISDKIGTTYLTPATDHLFQIRDKKEAKFLIKKAREFHRVTTQLLFLSYRAQQDI